MTAQIPDIFRVEGADYVYVAQPGATIQEPHYLLGPGPHLFHAADYELLPSELPSYGYGCTSCRRGCVCRYEVIDSALLLQEVALFADLNRLRPLRDVRPQPCESSSIHRFLDGQPHYLDLKMPVVYTGSIQVGGGVGDLFWMNIGWQLPYHFPVVKELVFEEGRLLRVHDHSALVAEQRRLGELPPREKQVIRSLG